MRERAVVVGCGVVGASVALELARRGWEVVVVERFAAPARGSTGKSSSVIRCHYAEPEAIKIALEGRRVWESWGEHLGLARPGAKFVRCGVLFLLPERAEAAPRAGALGVKAEASAADVARQVGTMTRLGVECEALRAEGLRRRFPYFRFADEGEAGIHEPLSGYVAYPREATEDLVEAGREAGVRFRFGERVEAIVTEGEDRRTVVSVRTDRRRVPCRVVVNAAGPWSHEVNLLARCPLPLATVPQRQVIVEARLDARSATGETPPATADLVRGFYIRPDPRAFRLGAILPRDHFDFRARPSGAAEPAARGTFLREKTAALRARWPAAGLARARPRTAWYDWTAADGHPILDRTDLDGFYVAIGTSGAWFKGGPVFGRLLAELVERVESGHDHDSRPLRATLPRTRHEVDLGVFSRRRSPISDA